MENTSLITTGGDSRQVRSAVAELREQVNVIQDAMRSVMLDGTHFGKIPGVEKDCLFKAGAEKLSMLFRLIPKFIIDERKFENGHREFFVTCELYSGGNFAGQGVGSCSTLETKYRWRKSERTCPVCGGSAIIKGKEEYGGGWICFSKRGGCGAKFKRGDAAIEAQETGRVENPDIADTWNTVLKMAKKRAHVDAVISATGASDIFTQDVEEGLIGPDETLPPRGDQKVIKDGPAPLSNPLAHVMTTNNPRVLGARIGSFSKDRIEWLSKPENGRKLSAEDKSNVVAAQSAVTSGTYDQLLIEYREIFGSDPIDESPSYSD